MAQRVLVFIEIVRGELSRGSREALALGRTLADAQGGELCAALFTGSASLCEQAISYGADVAYHLATPLAEGYQPEAYADVAAQVCRAFEPEIILLPHSPVGCDLAPRLSFLLGIVWATGCLDLRASGSRVIATRPLVGGKISVEETTDFPVLATLRPRIVEPLPRDGERRGETRELSVEPRGDTQSLRHREHFAGESGASEELAEAAVIVSGGFGMGSQEGLARLGELADLLGASLGGSKAAVDRGWVDAERQVGLTGVTVAPRLYVAVGISGSAQHMAGCGKSRIIIAINKDPEANIFKFCKYGIVGEWEQVLPLLVQKLRGSGTVGS